jgi:hypothetical protein
VNRPAMRFCNFAHNEESQTKSICKLARGLMIMGHQRFENRFQDIGRNRVFLRNPYPPSSRPDQEVLGIDE